MPQPALHPGDRRRFAAPFGELDRYLLRGIAGPIAAILVAMLVALMLERTLRLIRELAASGSDIGYLLPLLRQLAPYYVELAIPFAFMVALAVLVVRLDRRLELEAMLAAGVSLARIAAPLVGLGLALALLALLAGGWLEPYGRYAYRALRIDAANAGRVTMLQPRALFQPDDSLVVTFERPNPDGSAGEVFLWQRLDDGGELVLSGASGKVGFSPAGRRLGIDFSEGRYLLERPGSARQSFDFARLSFRQPLAFENSAWQRGWDQKELTLPELAAEARHPTRGLPPRAVAAELYERIARIAIIVLLPLLVLPLAFATKKGGRAFGLLLCGAVLALNQHALNAAKKVSLTGAIEPSLAILGTAGLIGAAIVAMFVSSRRLPSGSPVHALLDPAAKALARRAPKGAMVPGRGRSLGAYVAWEFAKWTLIALATMAVFLQAIELVERGDEFVKRGLGLADAGYYAALRLPAIVRQAAPMAALAGALAAFAQLASEREITAMRAIGVSQWRLLAMAAPVALALFAAVFALVEWTVPASQQRLAQWWAATAPAEAAATPAPRWFRIEDQVVSVGSASGDGARLGEVRIYLRDTKGRLARRIAAARAEHGASGWTLREVETTRFSPDRVEVDRAARARWTVPLEPGDVAAFFTAAGPALSAEMAQRALDQEAPVSLPESVFATRLQRSLAEPFGPLLMLLFALPLAFAVPRTGRYWPAMLYAGGAGLAFLVADGVLTAAAEVGYLPALLGAWGAPVLAALVGFNVLVLGER